MLPSFFLNKKTGFISSSNDIELLDGKGFLFYKRSFTGKKNKFNLPKGKYFLKQGLLKKIKLPVKFKMAKLPAIEHLGRTQNNLKVIISDNPNKCSIDYFNKIITLDGSYLKAPRIVVDFILAHELGHCFYADQSKADMYAGNLLIKHGYNPSQVLEAPNLVLSNRSISRKKKMLKYFGK